MLWKFSGTWISKTIAVSNKDYAISALFESEAFHIQISFIPMQTLILLRVNNANFNVKYFGLSFALKQVKDNSEMDQSGR